MAGHIERVVPASYMLHQKKKMSDVVEHGFIEKFYSKNDVRNGNLEFVVEGNAEHLIVPCKTYIQLEVEITGASTRTVANVTQTLATGGHIAPINNLIGSLFESVEVYVQNQATTKVDKHYPYIAYLQTLCNYGKESLDTYFRLSGWAKDTSGHMDDVEGTDNPALATRRTMFTNGKTELIGKIFSPLFFQEKALPTQTSLKLVMKKAQDNFILMREAGTFSINITKATLLVQKVSVVAGLKESYMQLLEENHPIPYYLKTPYVSYYTIERGSAQFMRDDLFLGKVPQKIVIGLVETAAYHGHIGKNPFNFKHCGLTEIGLYKDGMPFPRPLMQLNFTQKNVAEAYHNFLTSLKGSYTRTCPDITFDEYIAGFTLYSYDMSPDQMGSLNPGTMLNMNSNIRLEMKFHPTTTENITLLVYYENDHLMEIHRDRQVTVDL